MSILKFFSKSQKDYDAAAEFFITPELHIKENGGGDYTLAIDTGYEDLKRKVTRLNLEGSEVSIKTKTSYVDYQELYKALDIPHSEQVDPFKLPAYQAQTQTTKAPSKLAKTPTGIESGKSKPEPDINKPSQPTSFNAKYPLNALLAEDLPEAIRLKQDQIVEKGVFYKPLQVISVLVVQDRDGISEQEIATSYYLAPVSYIEGVYTPLSSAQCSHIVETSWSDAYIEAMNGDDTVSETSNSGGRQSKAKKRTSPFVKAPLIVALSLSAAFASLYGFNQYQQNNNPLTLAASNGTVGTYMNAKGSNTDEYTQRQLEATKAALSSMGIDVSAEADIGCLIE